MKRILIFLVLILFMTSCGGYSSEPVAETPSEEAPLTENKCLLDFNENHEYSENILNALSEENRKFDEENCLDPQCFHCYFLTVGEPDSSILNLDPCPEGYDNIPLHGINFNEGEGGPVKNLYAIVCQKIPEPDPIQDVPLEVENRCLHDFNEYSDYSEAVYSTDTTFKHWVDDRCEKEPCIICYFETTEIDTTDYSELDPCPEGHIRFTSGSIIYSGQNKVIKAIACRENWEASLVSVEDIETNHLGFAEPYFIDFSTIVNDDGSLKDGQTLNGYMIVFLFSDWCPICDEMKPIYNQLSIHYVDKIRFTYLHGEQHRAIVRAFIKKENGWIYDGGFPDTFYMKDGEYIYTRVGATYTVEENGEWVLSTKSFKEEFDAFLRDELPPEEVPTIIID